MAPLQHCTLTFKDAKILSCGFQSGISNQKCISDLMVWVSGGIFVHNDAYMERKRLQSEQGKI